MNINPLSHPSRSTKRASRGLALVAGGLTLFGGFALPGVAKADSCIGKTIYAHKNYEVLYGTCGNDTIFIGPYRSVTVYAGAGNDDVRAGWGGGIHTIHLGEGNDAVWNPTRAQPIIAYGEGGNDTLQGSKYSDVLDGGSGTDTAYVSAGDLVSSVEVLTAG